MPQSSHAALADPDGDALGARRMLGNALMVAPVLEQGAAAVSAYFPQGTWYSLYDHALLDASSGGAFHSVPVRGL